MPHSEEYGTPIPILFLTLFQKYDDSDTCRRTYHQNAAEHNNGDCPRRKPAFRRYFFKNRSDRNIGSPHSESVKVKCVIIQFPTAECIAFHARIFRFFDFPAVFDDLLRFRSVYVERNRITVSGVINIDNRIPVSRNRSLRNRLCGKACICFCFGCR